MKLNTVVFHSTIWMELMARGHVPELHHQLETCKQYIVDVCLWVGCRRSLTQWQTLRRTLTNDYEVLATDEMSLALLVTVWGVLRYVCMKSDKQRETFVGFCFLNWCLTFFNVLSASPFIDGWYGVTCRELRCSEEDYERTIVRNKDYRKSMSLKNVI